jgi:hypothetical protein
MLGLPPVWYKSAPYRSRVVKDPRGVLADFGVALPPSTAIRVWDSTAETRYMVLPMRPPGTDGWSEGRLALWPPGPAGSAVSAPASPRERDGGCLDSAFDAMAADHRGGAVVTAC